jgi:hypothetical protein
MKRAALLLAGALCIGFASHAQEPLKDGKKAPSKVVGGKGEPGQSPASQSSAMCSQHVCPVAVTANSCQTIAVNPDELKLKGKKEYQIVWTIPPSSKAAFRDQGIRFKSANSEPIKALGIKKAPQLALDGKQIRLVIKPTSPGRWYYAVLVNYGGKRCDDLDPVIINEM